MHSSSLTISQLADTSRIWIYQADRAMTADETAALQRAGDAFVQEWSSHGSKMAAAFEIKESRFAIIAADESAAKASGCGIDSSVHFMQDAGKQLNLDFFDRMRVCYRSGDEVKECKLPEIPALVASGAIQKETPFYDNLVEQAGALESTWLKPMGDSWMARYF